jgi:dienelactone hydrolase
MSLSRLAALAAALVLLVVKGVAGQDDLAARLRALDARVFSDREAKERQLDQMLAKDVRGRIHAAHRRLAREWEGVKTRADWERFRDERLRALRAALGPFPAIPRDLKVRVTGTLRGDGFRIEKVVYEGRPGLPVTANLYLPERPLKVMPGLIVCHSFFHPKSQPELQDLGVNGARAGCAVLVLDLLGHGECRQHPFTDAKFYAGHFNVPRQDYYTRATTGMQLDLIGDSLMGWMVGDVIRGVDVLLARPEIDRNKIAVLGAVASGGDVAGVAAALDRRITLAVPYNFGGPEPETPYPLPKEGELSFPYAAGGHWDCTRRLRNSARDGFLPWVVVGAMTPRRLIYAHEFAWDRDHDPVWARLEKIFALYNARDHLAPAYGSGTLFGKPEGTGCANIGAVHRKTLYPLLRRWFGIAPPEPEVQRRRSAEELLCLTPKVAAEFKPRPVYELAAELGAARAAAAHKRLAALQPVERRQQLRRDWARLLGEVEPKADPKVAGRRQERQGMVKVERVVLEVEPGIVVPLLLLLPPAQKGGRLPGVVGVAQEGKQALLVKRADEVAALLKGGAAVCLPDLRGTGETRPAGDLRGRSAGTMARIQRTNSGTLLASEERILGQTLLGARLRDLRSVLRYLRRRKDLGRLSLWGDSLAPANPKERNLAVPPDADKFPDMAEPFGGLLVLFAALFDEDVQAVYARGGLVGYLSVLRSPFCYVPHDVLVPGALTAGDLGDVASALAPRPLCLVRWVDGLNRRVSPAALARMVAARHAVYGDVDRGAAAWLLKPGMGKP